MFPILVLLLFQSAHAYVPNEIFRRMEVKHDNSPRLAELVSTENTFARNLLSLNWPLKCLTVKDGVGVPMIVKPQPDSYFVDVHWGDDIYSCDQTGELAEVLAPVSGQAFLPEDYEHPPKYIEYPDYTKEIWIIDDQSHALVRLAHVVALKDFSFYSRRHVERGEILAHLANVPAPYRHVHVEAYDLSTGRVLEPLEFLPHTPTNGPLKVADIYLLDPTGQVVHQIRNGNFDLIVSSASTTTESKDYWRPISGLQVTASDQTGRRVLDLDCNLFSLVDRPGFMQDSFLDFMDFKNGTWQAANATMDKEIPNRLFRYAATRLSSTNGSCQISKTTHNTIHISDNTTRIHVTGKVFDFFGNESSFTADFTR